MSSAFDDVFDGDFTVCCNELTKCHNLGLLLTAMASDDTLGTYVLAHKSRSQAKLVFCEKLDPILQNSDE